MSLRDPRQAIFSLQGWKKSRTSLHFPVQSRSENALSPDIRDLNWMNQQLCRAIFLNSAEQACVEMLTPKTLISGLLRASGGKAR
jgi:hypothetical protein